MKFIGETWSWYWRAVELVTVSLALVFLFCFVRFPPPLLSFWAPVFGRVQLDCPAIQCGSPKSNLKANNIYLYSSRASEITRRKREAKVAALISSTESARGSLITARIITCTAAVAGVLRKSTTTLIASVAKEERTIMGVIVPPVLYTPGRNNRIHSRLLSLLTLLLWLTRANKDSARLSTTG